MRRAADMLLSFIISFSLLFSNVCLAGEIVESGTTLSEDSYVFSIEEATLLMERISELEEMEGELLKYRELETVRMQQIGLYKANEEFYSMQIGRYQALDLTNQELLLKYQRRNNLHNIENASFFILGMAVTFSSIAVANSIVTNQNANY